MVKHKHLKEAMPLFIVLLLLGVFLMLDLAYTSYAVFEPEEINISLDKIDYLINEPLSGSFGVNFKGVVDDSTVFSIKILKNKTLSLKTILNELNINYTSREDSFEGVDPLPVKNLGFNSPGSQRIGIELPKDAELIDLSFEIEGIAKDGVYPNEPLINVNEGDEEWHFYGPRVGWKSQAIKPKGLKEPVKDYVTLYGESESMYCEKIRIPETRDIQINAKYKKYSGAPPGGDIVGRVYSFDGEFLTGLLECDLPEPDGVAKYRSCSIEPEEFSFDDKEYMVCVASEAGDFETEYYSLARENTGDSTGYLCNDYGCDETEYYDFFITVTEGVYNSELRGLEDLNYWETSAKATRIAIQTYLYNCVSEDPFCVVPLEIVSGSKGNIKLKNLLVKYSSSGGNAEQTNFLDLIWEKGAITRINGEELLDYYFEFPLSVFDFKVPVIGLISQNSTSEIEEKEFVVEFEVYPGDLYEEKEILVSTKENYTEPETFFDFEEIKTNLDSLIFSESEILSILGLKFQMDEVIDYFDMNENLTEEDVEDRISDLPEELNRGQKVTDSYIATPSDVSSVTNEEVYDFQKENEVTVEGEIIEIIKYSGDEEKYLKVKKKIKINEQITNVDIYEIIPKSVATGLDEIKFKDNTYQVVQEDPIVKYEYGIINAGEVKEISYLVLDGDLNKLSDIGTIIVPGENLIEPNEDSVCGDNYCDPLYEDEENCPEDCATKLPWLFIGLFILFIFILVWYISFYRGKYSFKKVFNNSSDVKPTHPALVKYIIQARLAGIDDAKIRGILIRKGWKIEDIKDSFKFAKK